MIIDRRHCHKNYLSSDIAESIHSLLNPSARSTVTVSLPTPDKSSWTHNMCDISSFQKDQNYRKMRQTSFLGFSGLSEDPLIVTLIWQFNF